MLARAIQMFMPGIPQVWYLDLFAGKNDYAAADRAGSGGHKEINRSNLSSWEIEQGLKKKIVQDQLELIKFRNSFPAFNGKLEVVEAEEKLLHLKWNHQGFSASLVADLCDYSFNIAYTDDIETKHSISHPSIDS